MLERSCDEHAVAIKRIAGWVFCHMFNFYFGESLVIFAGEGTGGEDITFSVSHEWLLVNQSSNFKVSYEIAMKSMAHTENCKSDQCVEAEKRLGAINPFFENGKLPGGSALIVVSCCQGKSVNDKVYISRENGFGEVIDEIMPFIKWIVDEKDFWVQA